MTEDLFTRVQEFLEKNSYHGYRYSNSYLDLRAELTAEIERLIKCRFKYDVLVILGYGGGESLLFDNNQTIIPYRIQKFKNEDVFLGHIMKDFIFGCPDPGA